MTEPVIDEPRKPSIRRRLLQTVGFVVGLLLLGWCIRGALSKGDYRRLADADLRLVIGLIVCTMISVTANGAIFWSLIQPLSKLTFWSQQFINWVVNLLNYAPIRIGPITRIAHHRRVDGLSFLTLFAWYSAFVLLYLLMIGALLGASVIRPEVDFIWFIIVFLQIFIGCYVLIRLSSHHWLVVRARGADRVLSQPGPVSAAMLFRAIDIAAFTARLYLAFQLLGISLSVREVILLSLVGMLGNLSPAGALGFREFAVTMIAPLLASNPELSGQIESPVQTAVLIDRASEVLVFIPMGIFGLIWMRCAWKRTTPGQSSPASEDAAATSPDERGPSDHTATE